MRLDHLLSKEHHEIQARPRLWEFGDLDDSLDGLTPVVGGGLVHMANMRCRLGNAGSRGLLNTLLGFETTSPRLVCSPVGVGRGVGPIGFGWCCCCPAWWWGVVFDSWIVVASIKLAYVMDLVSSGMGFLSVWWFVVV